MPIELNAGSGGSQLATDQIGGEEFQKVRLVGGGTSETAAYSASNPVPVYLAGSPSLTHTFVITGTAGGDVLVSLDGEAVTVNDGPVVSLSSSYTVVLKSNRVSLSSSYSMLVAGMAAHDAAVAGNPVLVGLEARTSNPAAVGNGDAVRGMADDMGRQIVMPFAPRDLITTAHRTSLSASTTQTLFAAGGAGVFRDLLSLVLSNRSSTVADVIIYDGLAAGTEKFRFELAADGGGAVINFTHPFPQDTANNGWAIKSTELDVSVTAQAMDTV